MTLIEEIEKAAHELDTERRTRLAELDSIEAALDAIEARYGFHEMISDARSDTRELRTRLLAMGDHPTVH